MSGSVRILAGLACVIGWLVGTSSVHAARVNVPAWVKAAAVAIHPDYPAEVPAVVLLDEGVYEVQPTGRMVKTSRVVVKALTRDGLSRSRYALSYVAGADVVRSARAWLIRPDGSVREYTRKEFVDTARFDFALYSEERALSVSAVREAVLGSVFAYEFVVEDKSIFTHETWIFETDVPVVRSSFVMTVPPGWEVRSRTFNHDPIEPVRTGGRYEWTLEARDAVAIEDLGPERTSVAAWLAIDRIPPAVGLKHKLLSFSTWADVVAYEISVADPQVIVDATVQAKALELVAGASSEWERIRAIGRFAQAVNYCHITTGTGLGGGYKPHASTEVLAKNYGDCKDKVALMRALLKAVDIESHAVGVYSGARVVREEWPSVAQFNHAIIAIEVSERLQSPAVIHVDGLGRFLIFDPTSEHTVLGDLPYSIRGQQALIAKAGCDRLHRLPVFAPEANLAETKLIAEVSASGGIRGTIREWSHGQAGAFERGLFRRASQTDYREVIERWIGERLGPISVRRSEPRDDPDTGIFDLEVEFEGENFARRMRDRILMFKPAAFASPVPRALPDKARVQPLVLTSKCRKDRWEYAIPEGFRVSESPPPVAMEGAFGRFAFTVRSEEGRIICERSLSMPAQSIAPSDYAAARAFFAAITKAEQVPVVLERL